jgi:hypothetical protein
VPVASIRKIELFPDGVRSAPRSTHATEEAPQRCRPPRRRVAGLYRCCRNLLSRRLLSHTPPEGRGTVGGMSTVWAIDRVVCGHGEALARALIQDIRLVAFPGRPRLRWWLLPRACVTKISILYLRCWWSHLLLPPLRSRQRRHMALLRSGRRRVGRLARNRVWPQVWVLGDLSRSSVARAMVYPAGRPPPPGH